MIVSNCRQQCKVRHRVYMSHGTVYLTVYQMASDDDPLVSRSGPISDLSGHTFNCHFTTSSPFPNLDNYRNTIKYNVLPCRRILIEYHSVVAVATIKVPERNEQRKKRNT